MKITRYVVFLALVSLSAACTPVEATRGNIVEDYRLTEVVPGVSSKTSVLKSLGSPTTEAPFDENVWYYIGEKTEKRGIFDPKVVDKKIVVVSFNQDGIVQAIDHVNADQIDVPAVRRKTPTSGNEMTVMQQLLGNIGRFNKSKESVGSVTGADH